MVHSPIQILAQIGDWSRWSDVSSLGLSRIGVLAAGLAVGVLIAWCYSRWSRKEREEDAGPPHSPQKLFRELCKAHRLSAAQQRLLEWLAAERQLLQPAMVFLDPILLESAIVHADSPNVRKRLTELRSRIFAGLEQPAGEGSKA